RIDLAAGWVLVTVGLLHGLLTLRRARGLPVPPTLVSSGALMMLVGFTNVAAAHPLRGNGARRIVSFCSLFGSAAGIALALSLMSHTPAAPQGLPLLMIFGVAAVLTLTR